MNFKNNKFSFFIIVAIYIVGLTCGVILRDIPQITIKKEVTIAELINIFLAIFLAVYVPFYLNKHIDNKRSEKDILIKACNNLDDELKSLKEIVDTSYKPQKNIGKDIAHKIILKVAHINKLLGLLDNNLNPYKLNKTIVTTLNDLINNNTALWKHITSNLSDKSPSITEDNYLNFEKDYYDYMGNISKLILCLNNT